MLRLLDKQRTADHHTRLPPTHRTTALTWPKFQSTPHFRRDAAAVRTRPPITVTALEKPRMEYSVRKTLIALAATTGLLSLGTPGASAAPLAPPHDAPSAVAIQGTAIQKADWNCGPRCEYWRHERWEHRRWERRNEWRDYGYNRGYDR